MADTIRTKSALQTLLADNTTQNVTPQIERDFLVSVDPENAVQTGGFASIPTAQKGGFVYFCNDAPYLVRDTGAAQEYWGPIWKMTLPVDASYSWLNQGSATVTTSGGLIHLASPGAGSDNIRARVKTAPATPYTITAYIEVYSYPGSSGYGGLCFSDGTKLMTFGVGTNTGGQRNQLSKWTTTTAFSANYLDLPSLSYEGNWVRIADDGTNRICSFSPDGFNWVSMHSIGRTDFLTATQVGFFLQTNVGVGKNIALSIFSWKEG